MSLLETMSYGVVPVVTDVGSIGEYVKNRENGFLIKKENVTAIVTALEQLIGDSELLKKMSVASRETIVKMLNPKEYVKKLNMIYSIMNRIGYDV